VKLLLRAALELAPGHPRLHKLLGSALFAMCDLPGAEAALRRALDLRPDYADAW
jgi:cytochrome c-type biogenesis protein CcmH/NrfG